MGSSSRAGFGQGVCFRVVDADCLVEAVATWAKAHDFRTLSLWVTESNKPALRLYERSRLPRTTSVVLGARARGDRDQTPSRWVALKRDVLIALRTRFGSDRTGRDFAWLYDYDAGSMDCTT